MPDPEAEQAQLVVLAAVPELASAGVVAAYRAFRGEPDLSPLLSHLALRRVAVLLPQLLADNDLSFHGPSGDEVAARHRRRGAGAGAGSRSGGDAGSGAAAARTTAPCSDGDRTR